MGLAQLVRYAPCGGSLTLLRHERGRSRSRAGGLPDGRLFVADDTPLFAQDD
jgi:hypothetical protein